MIDPRSLVGELSENPESAALAQRVKRASEVAFRERRPELRDVEPLDPPSLRGAASRLGNALEILQRGATTAEEWELLGALWALGTRGESSAEDVEVALWLETQTSLPALRFADTTWSSPARQRLFEAVERGCLDPARPTAERRALVAALSLARSEEGARAAAKLSAQTRDPTARTLLSDLCAGAEPLEGELSFGRTRLRTTLLAVTGLLFLLSLLRLVGRYVVGARRRATLVLHADGLGLTQRTVLLGKPLSTVERFIPIDQIVALGRETRHAGFTLYAGLFALALGSYLGMGLVGDAFRAPGGSPSLLGTGLLLIASGVALDFALVRVAGFRGPRARIVIEPRRGRPLVLTGGRVQEADAWLRGVTRSRGWAAHAPGATGEAERAHAPHSQPDELAAPGSTRAPAARTE